MVQKKTFFIHWNINKKKLCRFLKKWDSGNDSNDNVSQHGDDNNDNNEDEEKCESSLRFVIDVDAIAAPVYAVIVNISSFNSLLLLSWMNNLLDIVFGALSKWLDRNKFCWD